MAIHARKQPNQPRSRARVAAILEAAAHVLEERGIEGYNTNAIARRATISVGSIYQYFPDKDAITAALIRRETAALLAEADHARHDPGSREALIHEALIHVIDAAVRHRLRRPVLAWLIDMEETRLPLTGENPGIGARLRQLIVELLSRPGLTRIPDRSAAAGDLIAIINGMVDVAASNGEGDATQLARRVRAAAFGYLDRIGQAA